MTWLDAWLHDPSEGCISKQKFTRSAEQDTVVQYVVMHSAPILVFCSLTVGLVHRDVLCCLTQSHMLLIRHNDSRVPIIWSASRLLSRQQVLYRTVHKHWTDRDVGFNERFLRMAGLLLRTAKFVCTKDGKRMRWWPTHGSCKLLGMLESQKFSSSHAHRLVFFSLSLYLSLKGCTIL